MSFSKQNFGNITRHERMTYITMGGLDHVQVSTFSPKYRIVFSWDFLAWISVADSIPSSFIPTPELSEPLHTISPRYLPYPNCNILYTLYGINSLLSLNQFFFFIINCQTSLASQLLSGLGSTFFSSSSNY